MGYRLSRKAEEDIINLYLEGLEQFGDAQAERYHRGLGRVFEFLARHPEAARERQEISPSVRVHRYVSHIVIYKIEDEEVYVLRVRHGSEDWQSDPV